MPFTLSHPSAALPVWPLVRRGLIPLAPFAIGAMAPDFEYLLRLEPYALLSHSARGLVLFCLPAGVAALLLWQRLLRPTAHALVGFGQGEAGTATADTARVAGAAWGRSLVALLLGSASHITWDAFTHRDAWGPALFPALKTTAIVAGGLELPWYNVLQMASSLAGGGVVLAWLVGAWRARGVTLPLLRTPWRVRAWSFIMGLSLAVALWNAPRQGIMSHITRTKLVLGRMAVGALVGGALALVLLALWQRFGRRDAREDQRRAPA